MNSPVRRCRHYPHKKPGIAIFVEGVPWSLFGAWPTPLRLGSAGDVQRRPSPRRGCGGAENLKMAHSVIFTGLAESHFQPTSRKFGETRKPAIFRSPRSFSRK